MASKPQRRDYTDWDKLTRIANYLDGNNPRDETAKNPTALKFLTNLIEFNKLIKCEFCQRVIALERQEGERFPFDDVDVSSIYERYIHQYKTTVCECDASVTFDYTFQGDTYLSFQKGWELREGAKI